MLIELAKGASFLLALCFIQSFIARRWQQDELAGQILSGILFGTVCAIGMLAPITVAPGHIADARSVVMSVAGLFGGPVVGGIAAVIGGGFRAWLGGGGAPLGVIAVFIFVLLGLAYRYCHQRGWIKIGFLQLLAFGLIVHLVLVYMFTFLPEPVVHDVMENVALPLVLSFAPMTALLGMMLLWIDRQIRTENALVESQRRFKDIAKITSDWMWEMGPDLRFSFLSNQGPGVLARAVNRRIQAIRDGASRLDTDECPEKWTAHVADLEARQPFRNFEFTVSTTNEGPRYYRSSGSPVFTDDGAFLGYRGAASDITVEKTAEKALRRSEEHYRDLFHGLEVGIHVSTRDKGRVFANPACARLFGYETIENLMDAPRGSLIAPHEHERVTKILRDLHTGVYERIQFEYDGQNADGTQKPTQVFARRIQWSGETAVMETLIDMSETKLAEKQLRQAQKMEAVGQLTSGVAHDFNNILTAVTGNLTLASGKVESGSAASHFINKASDAAWRAAMLTRRLLAFSREQDLNPRRVDAFELVEGMADLLQRTVSETISIECRSTPDLWICEVDPNQLESAILNLAINARDAMPEGGKLTISTRNGTIRDDAEAARSGVSRGKYVVISIADTGTGMSQDVLEKAFDPFFTSKPVGKGSGLGLSMVHGFVNQSGGHVTIDSEEGRGTTVHLYLPRSRAVAKEVAVKAEKTEHPDAQAETILIVEDDPEVRELNSELLSSLGYRVLEAANGRDAISIALKTPRIDLLFTDIMLPGGMMGTEAATEVMRHHSGIAVLFASGYTKDSIPKDCLKSENFALLEKPYEVTELVHKVRAVIENTAAAKDGRDTDPAYSRIQR